MRKIDLANFRRATRTTAREVNRSIALNLVRERQPISRADLARAMAVSRGTVTALVQELLVERSVYEGETGPSPRGRRPTLLYVRTRDRLVVAIDVRGSRTSLMMSDFAGREIALESCPTPAVPEALVREVGTRVRRLRRAHRARGQVEGIGLVISGMVDADAGRVLRAPQLGWRDVALRRALERRTRLPVAVENAARACALAQLWMGPRGAVLDDFVYITVSEGVGAGIVRQGELVRGHTNTAGEFGHVPLDPEGPHCACGARGCWEAYTSNHATVDRYLGRTTHRARPARSARSPTIEDVIARARSGDARARDALAATGHYLGIGMAGIVNALNPSRILVGGEIATAWELVSPTLRRALATRALTRASAATPVEPALLGGHPRLRGATALVAAPAFAAPAIA